MCAVWYKPGAQNIPVHPSQRGNPLITNYEFNCIFGIITEDQNRIARGYVCPLLQLNKRRTRLSNGSDWMSKKRSENYAVEKYYSIFNVIYVRCSTL